MAPRKERDSRAYRSSTAGVRLRGVVEQVVLEPACPARRRPPTRPRRPSPASSLVASASSPAPSSAEPGVLDELGEVAVVGDEVGALLDAGLDLAARARRCPWPRRRAGSPSSPSSAPGTCVESSADDAPVLVGGGGHEVEAAADLLQGRGDDVEGHLVEPGPVGLLGEAEALAHGGQGDPVDVVDGGRPGRAGRGCRPRRSAWASWPAGEKSSSSSSWPAMPR